MCSKCLGATLHKNGGTFSSAKARNSERIKNKQRKANLKVHSTCIRANHKRRNKKETIKTGFERETSIHSRWAFIRKGVKNRKCLNKKCVNSMTHPVSLAGATARYKKYLEREDGINITQLWECPGPVSGMRTSANYPLEGHNEPHVKLPNIFSPQAASLLAMTNLK